MMMDNQLSCNLIERSALIADLNPEQCAELSNITTVRLIKNGETLIKQGEIDDALHIVGYGNLAVERITAGGDTITLRVLKPGDLAGAMGFVDGTEHTATLRALGDSTVISLKRQDLEAVLHSSPALVYGVMRGVVRSVHQIMREMNLQHVELSNYITKTHGRY
jgi:CRP/FNR family cyclic AMP-dependent transcriptional regulator